MEEKHLTILGLILFDEPNLHTGEYAKIIQQLNVLWNGCLMSQFRQIACNYYHYCTKFSTNQLTDSYVNSLS